MGTDRRIVGTGRRVMAVVIMFLFLVGTVVPASAAVKVSKVTVKSPTGSTKTVYVGKGKKVSLKTTVTVTPNKAANKTVTYSVKNKKIATVSSKGVLHGKKVGTTKVTVTSKKNPKKSAVITVKVKKPVTKVKLNSSSATVLTGATRTLKASVTPSSGAYTKVKWSSSDKSVATVTQTGVVSGIKKGTATIRATACDGSNKSASCKVTVEDPVSITGVEVLDNQGVRVTLSQAQSLQVSDFKVMKKQYSTGSYLNECVVQKMTTSDSKVYDLTLAKESAIPVGYYVQVCVAALDGVAVMETIYTGITKTTGYAYVGGEVGKPIEEKTVSFEKYTAGTVAFTVGTLPAGISYKVKEREVVFSGTPTAAAQGTPVEVVATDELGNQGKVTVYFYIGSSQTLAAYCEPICVLAGTEINQKCVSGVFGGSGNYTYAFDGDSNGLTMDSATGEMTGNVSVPGTYSLKVKVSDKGNSALTATVLVSLTVEQAVYVKGQLVDATGKPISRAMVAFSPLDEDVVLPQTAFMTDDSGNYTATVTPGVYNVTAQMANILNGDKVETVSDSMYRLVVPTSGTSGVNFKLGVYQVNVVSGISGNYDFGDWNYQGKVIGNGYRLYVGPGTYNNNQISSIAEELADDGTKNGKKYTAIINMTVNSAVTAPITATATMTAFTEDSDTKGE